MANFCIMPEYVDKFKKALVEGKISPEKLADMSSKEREVFLKDFVGEGIASKVNAEFEAKMLLKNQKQGMITWAKQVAGINKATRMDIIAKIERMDRVLQPEEGKQFMASLAERRLGVGVTEEQAKTILEMSKKVTEAKTKQTNGVFTSESARMDYGRAVFDMTDFVNAIKGKAKGLKLADLQSRPTQFIGKAANTLASTMKAMKAGWDNSALGRQGRKLLTTHPTIWVKNSLKTFETIAKEIGGHNMKRELTADVVSRPNYIDGTYQKMGLSVGNLEEAFPTTLPEKVPGIGRIYKASDAAFTGFIQTSRADVADLLLEKAKKIGIDITNKEELKPIGNFVNALTGRANLGKYENAANIANNFLFSPRLLVANFQTFTQPLTGAGGSNFVRKEAAKSLLGLIGSTATIMEIANILQPGSMELDPRSSDFGKIKIGDARFDITGGISSIVTLASRLGPDPMQLLTGKGYHSYSKSSSSGIVSELNSGGYGAQTTLDVLSNYASNKLSPAAGAVRDVLRGTDFNGNKVTAPGVISNMFLPLIVANYQQLAENPNTPGVLIGTLADALGISVNVYSAKGSTDSPSWTNSTSAQIKAFKDKVGNDNFISANKQFDTAYNSWLNAVRANPEWDKKTSEEKKALLSAEATQLQKDIFKMYNFTYKAPKTAKPDTSLLKALNNVK